MGQALDFTKDYVALLCLTEPGNCALLLDMGGLNTWMTRFWGGKRRTCRTVEYKYLVIITKITIMIKWIMTSIPEKGRSADNPSTWSSSPHPHAGFYSFLPSNAAFHSKWGPVLLCHSLHQVYFQDSVFFAQPTSSLHKWGLAASWERPPQPQPGKTLSLLRQRIFHGCWDWANNVKTETLSLLGSGKLSIA